MTGCLPSTRRASGVAPTTEQLGEAPVQWARRTVRALTPVPRDGESLTRSFGGVPPPGESHDWPGWGDSSRVVISTVTRGCTYHGGWSERTGSKCLERSDHGVSEAPQPRAGARRAPHHRIAGHNGSDGSLGPGRGRDHPDDERADDRAVKVAAAARGAERTQPSSMRELVALSLS